ncbi:MAG: transposase [Chitinophagaceae bacterium]
MAKSKVKPSLRTRRIFSDELKRKLVKDIEDGKVSVTGVSREYSVSFQAVYAWLPKFSSSLSSSKILVVQMDSEQYKTRELQRQVLELEAALGRKQMEVDYLNKVIDFAGNDLGMDLKKNISSLVLDGSAKTSKKSDLP